MSVCLLVTTASRAKTDEPAEMKLWIQTKTVHNYANIVFMVCLVKLVKVYFFHCCRFSLIPVNKDYHKVCRKNDVLGVARMPHGDEGQFWRVIRGHAERDACGRYYQRYSLGATGSPSTHRRRRHVRAPARNVAVLTNCLHIQRS